MDAWVRIPEKGKDNIILSYEYEPEGYHVQCHSPTDSANSTIWKAMPIIIQGARSA